MGSWFDLKSNNIDLDIRIDKLENDSSDTYYSVITDAPVPGLGRLHPFDATTLLRTARELEQKVEKVVGSVDDLANIQSPLNIQFVEMGNMLFNALFPPGTASRSCFALCFRRVVNGELGPTKRLRLKLYVHETLHNLPWELLHYTGTDLSGLEDSFFLAAHSNTAVVRYMGNTVWRSENTLGQTPLQLGILVVVARPIFSNVPEALQKAFSESVNREKEAIMKTLQPLADAGQIRVSVVEGDSTLSKLHQKADENTHILHYIGHGGYYPEFGSFLVGENQVGFAAEIIANDLASVLNSKSPNLRLVVLNACRLGKEHSDTLYGGVAFRLAQSLGIPAVVAMKFLIRTDTAEVFGREFYGQLVNKRSSVYEALRFSCSQISMTNRIEWATPLLIMSSINGLFVDFPLIMPVSAGLATEATPKESTAVESSATRMVEAESSPPMVNEPEMVMIPASESIAGIDEKQANLIVKRIFSGGYNIAGTAQDREGFKKQLLKERARKIKLPAFLIYKFPVTNEEFERFVKATGYQTDAEQLKEVETWHTYYKSLEKAKHPVVCVSWNDATAYANWAHKRLPTAEEWEKAARGPNGNLYPWGNDWDPLKCNNQGSMRGFQTTPVDTFESGKSSYGVYDMVGNVCEWTSTEIEGYRVVLGGSWEEACEIFGLAAFGRRSPPSLASNDLGFRCVRAS